MGAYLLVFTDEQKHRWKERALEEGRTLAGWIRFHLDNVPQDKDNAIWVQKGREAALERKARLAWRIKVKELNNYICFRCAIKMTKYTSEAHHVIPTKEGGKDILENGVVVCSSCHHAIHQNLKKGIGHIEALKA